MEKESILVLGSPGGGVRRMRVGERFSGGFLGLSLASVRGYNEPLPTAPKDVATLSLKVLKDSESAARLVGRYLLHAKAVVCPVLPP